MKKFLKNEGFTLVELIVVIAILGILAAVAVPAYTGYITKANQAADITTCDAIKTAVVAAYTEEGDAAPAVIQVSDAHVKVGAAVADVDDLEDPYLSNFATYYGAAMGTVNVDHTSTITWTAGEWKFD